MSEFKCSRCKKTFNRAYNLKRHYERKNPCKVVESYQTIPNHTKIIPNHTKIIPNHTSIIPAENNNQKKDDITVKEASNKCNKFICKYCKSEFTNKNSLYRHINELRCQSIPIQKKKYIENKSQSKALLKKKNQLMLYNEKNTINSNLPNNSTNIDNKNLTNINNPIIHNTLNNINSNSNTTNNIINNFTLKINPLGQENTSFLTKEDKIRLLERMYNGVPELIKTIHSHPENRNFFLPNINKNIVAYLNSNNEIQYDNRDEICQQIIDNNIDRLDDFFNEFKNEIKTTMKDRIEKIIDKNQENANHDKYFNEVNLFLLKISKKHRKELNTYLDKLEADM